MFVENEEEKNQNQDILDFENMNLPSEGFNEESIQDKDDAIQSVMNICCNKSKEEVEDALHDSDWNISEAVGTLLEESHAVVSSKDSSQQFSETPDTSIKDIISFYAESVIDNIQQTKLVIRHEEI